MAERGRFREEVALRREFGGDVGWIANVVNQVAANPSKQLKGLRKLAQEGRVASVVFHYDLVNIGGEIKPMGSLQDYA